MHLMYGELTLMLVTFVQSIIGTHGTQKLKINNSSLTVDKNNDTDTHFTALVDENRRYCWSWYKMDHYQLSIGEGDWW